MEISVFRGARNTTPDNLSISWDGLCDLASDLMAMEFARSNKLAHHAMIFGRCEGSRANANVRFHSGLCADFDIGPADVRYMTFDQRCDWLDARGLAYVAYTTTKNSAGHQKYRLIMPYARDVEAERCKAAWHACNAKLGGAIDASTHDEARLSFLPAAWTENPFWQPGARKGEPPALITLVEPFNAMRVNRGGAPILSEAESDALPWPDAATTARRASYSAGTPQLTDAQRAELAKGHEADSPVLAWLANLRGPLVQPWMLRDLPLEEGNREYRFMKGVARHAIRKGFPITNGTLTVLTEQFSTECLGRAPAGDFPRQAENALSWALHKRNQEPCQPEAGDQL